MQTVDLYIDTSIKGPKRKWGCYLYVLAVAGAERVTRVAKGMEQREDTTEHQLTAMALGEALGRMNRPCHITIWLNSPYIAAVLANQWDKQWKAADWCISKGRPVCDAEIWKVIEEKMEPHECEIRLRQHHTFTEWMQWVVRDANKDNFQRSREKALHF